MVNEFQTELMVNNIEIINRNWRKNRQNWNSKFDMFLLKVYKLYKLIMIIKPFIKYMMR